MAIQTRKSLKQTLLEKLGNIGEVAFPLLGIAKKTYIETPLSTANKLNQEANRLTQLAEQEQDINRKRELYRQSLNLSQQAAQLSQKSASNVPKVIGAGQLALKGAGIAAGSALSAPTTIAGIAKGLTQATSGSVADIITSKLLPEQMKAVEEQRQKDILKTYRAKYPEAPVSPDLPIAEQEQAYKEYLKAPYLRTYKPTLPAGYKEPQTITGQTWEGIQAGALNTFFPSMIKSAQSVLNKAGLYDISGQLENKTQQLQAYTQSRLDLQSPNFSELFKQNPANASKLYVARMFGETLPYIGAMVIPPLLTRQSNYFTTIAPIQFVAKGTFLRDIENTVQDKTVADSLATIYGGINAIIETFLAYTPAGLAKWLSQPVQQVSRTAFLQAIKSLPRTAVRILVNSINEGNEEVLQQIAENILRKWAGDKSVQTTLTDLAQNWLGGFAGSLPLGVSQIGTTQAGLTVQPTIGNEAIGQTDKQGRTIVNITPMENTYAVSYMDKTGKVDGMVLTPAKFKEYLQKNFPQIQITSPETTPELELLKRKKEYLLEQNEQISEQLEELEDKGQIGTDLYNKLNDQREQNGKAIQELTNQINALQQSLPKPVETPKVEKKAQEKIKPLPKELEPLAEEVRKYKSAEEFVNAFFADYGKYPFWHLTDKPNFNISKTFIPKDASSLNIGLVPGEPGLMATQDLDYWMKMMKNGGLSPRQYAVKLDLSNLEYGKDYVYVDRGFGNEINIRKDALDKVKIKKQVPISQAVKEYRALQKAYKQIFGASDITGTKEQIQQKLTDFYNQAVKGAKQETRTELQPKQMPPQPEETQPVVEKAIPVVEENLPETTSFAINQALLRLAQQQGISIDQLPTHEVENIKQTVKTTTDWYNSLTPEQKDTYIASGQLPPNISKPIFADLYSKEAVKGDTTKQRLLLDSPIYQELTEAGRLLREQKEVVDSVAEVVKTVQDAKRQRVSKRLGVKIDDLEDKIKVVNRRLTHQINLQTLSDFIVQHPQLRNPELVDAVRLGEVNLLELATHPYKDIVDTLAPYIQDPELLRQAALELQGKQFLQRISAGVTYWIKKWGIAEPSFSDRRLTQLVNQFLAQLQPSQLTWQEQQKILKQFTETLSGYILSDEELKKAMEIADILITVRSLPDFTERPSTDPEIEKYGQAELSYLHLINDMKGRSLGVSQWWKEVSQTFISTWKEQDFWKALGTLLNELNDISISLRANIDNSFIGRQGRPTMWTHPQVWLKGAKKSFEAWFSSNPSKVIDAYLLDLFKDPLYRNGYYIKTKVVNVNLELYPSEVPTKLPLIGNIFQRSIAAYTLAQVEMRRGVAQSVWNVWQGNPITVHGEQRTTDFLHNKEELRAAKEIIGVSTSSGLAGTKGITHFLVWSPSMIVSEFKTLSNLIGAWTSDIPEIKKAQIRQAWTRLMGDVLFQYLANLLLRSIYKDWDDNPIVFDPTDQRWGEIYLGHNIKYRSPLLSLISLGCISVSSAFGGGYRSRTSRKRVKVGEYGFEPFDDIIVSYFKNKFAPITSITVDIINNEIMGGKKITAGRIGQALFAPFTLENISDLKEVEEWRQPSAILAIIVDALGLNTTTMIHKIQLDKSIVSEVSRLQELDIPDIQQARYDGFMNEFKALSVKENQKFFEVLSKQLNTSIGELIDSEPYKAASDEKKADALQKTFDNIVYRTKLYWVQHQLQQKSSPEAQYQLLHRYTVKGFVNDELYRDLVKYGIIPYSLIQYAQSKSKKP